MLLVKNVKFLIVIFDEESCVNAELPVVTRVFMCFGLWLTQLYKYHPCMAV